MTDQIAPSANQSAPSVNQPTIDQQRQRLAALLGKLLARAWLDRRNQGHNDDTSKSSKRRPPRQ